jgi:DNA polymerase-4
VVTLKLKRADHRILTRRVSLRVPTHLADVIWRAADPLLAQSVAEGPFRLIGVGLSDLFPLAGPGFSPDLLDPAAQARAKAEAAIDALRARFGDSAVIKGRSLR